MNLAPISGAIAPPQKSELQIRAEASIDHYHAELSKTHCDHARMAGDLAVARARVAALQARNELLEAALKNQAAEIARLQAEVAVHEAPPTMAQPLAARED